MLSLFKSKQSACTKCGKEIANNEEAFAKIRYPEMNGMTAIKIWLTLEATFYA
ncbi:hypothetical protein [Halalkalibacterium ligniniphilum]|uniref:hypothetical protein n=1 Tax=Halalkalibacterium ligniniphilum TaxID=1134413 RepID=UPI00034BEB98|nr:hypothetical protein [Halalkalibacterium ligniniphilum]